MKKCIYERVQRGIKFTEVVSNMEEKGLKKSVGEEKNIAIKKEKNRALAGYCRIPGHLRYNSS